MKIKDWHTEVAALGCIVTGNTWQTTIHHIKAGSVLDLGLISGISQRGISDWLVIPLSVPLHTAGKFAIDGGFGVLSWEETFGRQVYLMDRVCRLTGTNAWHLANVERDPWLQSF